MPMPAYLLAPQVVYGFEYDDLDRCPLWVVHDPQDPCSKRAHVIGATRRWITDEPLVEHIYDDTRCVACIAGCGCACRCYNPPEVTPVLASRSGRVRRARGPVVKSLS